MSLTCVSLTCAHQKGLFCRVASGVLWCLPLILTTYGGKLFFCFSSFSSLSFDITLTPHSGSLTGTQEGDQETSPSPKQKQKQTGIPDLLCTHLSTNTRKSRKLSSCVPVSWALIRWRHLKGRGNSNKLWKFKLFAHFGIFQNTTFLPPPLPPQHVVYTFCPHISATGSQGNVYTVR